jgi:hypothetical protein
MFKRCALAGGIALCAGECPGADRHVVAGATDAEAFHLRVKSRRLEAQDVGGAATAADAPHRELEGAEDRMALRISELL